MTYPCILADPPWNERGGGKIKRGADRHYPLMKTPDIIRTMLAAPCWQPADDSHLWMWVTNNFLEDGLFVMKSLGFRYVTNAVWAKTHFGLGQYQRGQHELMLLGVRGRLPYQSRSTPSLIGGKLLEARRHSKKPDEARAHIEAVTPGPRLEMFAREFAPGWTSWGNETTNADT